MAFEQFMLTLSYYEQHIYQIIKNYQGEAAVVLKENEGEHRSNYSEQFQTIHSNVFYVFDKMNYRNTTNTFIEVFRRKCEYFDRQFETVTLDIPDEYVRDVFILLQNEIDSNLSEIVNRYS